MADYIHSVPWTHTGRASGTSTPSRLHLQLRSLSPVPIGKTVTKSSSTPHLGRAIQERLESEALNTIPDPRAPTPRIVLTRSNSSESVPHPDLSQEVATLSTKLINAINHQTTLDDTLQQARHDLDAARERLEFVEPQLTEYEQRISAGLLVDKVVYDKMEKQLLVDLQEEKKRRIDAEQAKRRTDAEIETLTAALFQEANVMVSAARHETEACEKRNEQLKQQLNDAAVLQQSLQDQIQDLKNVVEKMHAQADDETNTMPTTAPSTPGITPADKMSKLFEAANLTPNTPGSDGISPDHPLHFSHLIYPVLRSDLASYQEFQDMLKISTRSAPSSRVSSGNYGNLSVLGLGSLTNTSTSSLPSTRAYGANTPNPRDSPAGAGMPNLKDEKFYKRTLSEDIEPTLRLDLAPGLSWMARRTVLNSITVASLVVEPSPPVPRLRLIAPACSLCGESRKGDEYARKFRFKTSEVEENRHPLCDWCLGRVRSTCDYISFLRMVAAGHWKAETEEEKKSTWEECVRLRERMFWCRIGGGVVPAFLQMRDSPRSPSFPAAVEREEITERAEDASLAQRPTPTATAATETPTEKGRMSEDDPFQSTSEVKRVSIGQTVISSETSLAQVSATADDTVVDPKAEAQPQGEVPSKGTFKFEDRPLATLQHKRSYSTPPKTTPSTLPSRKKEERLSLAIPGGFD